MRAILFTEELMGVALKFSKKSSTMGSLWVSWEPAAGIPTTSASNSCAESPSKINRIAKGPALRKRIQAGISLCFATLFFTILVFFLVCSLDSSFAIKNFNHPSPPPPSSSSQPRSRAAVTQGMGTIFRRGTRSMSEMVIAHVTEDVSSDELRLFLRILQRSGLGGIADVVLLFSGDPRALGFAAVVEDELRTFHRLLGKSGCLGSISSAASSNRSGLGPSCQGGGSSGSVLLASNCSLSRLNLAAFHRAEEESRARAQAALAKIAKNSTLTQAREEEIVQWAAARRNPPPPLGSVMGFDVAELDPLDTLAGFLDSPPIQLRRWLCYQMLLGLAKQQHHRYRNVVITQVRGVFLLGDSLLAIARKHRDSRALVLVTEDRTWLQDAAFKNLNAPREILAEDEEFDPEEDDRRSRKERRRRRRRRKPGLIEEVYGHQVWGSIEREDKAEWAVVSSAVLAGGTRAVRSLADAVATEVARAAMMRRSRRPFDDQAAINYVVRRNANVLGRKVVEQMVFVDGAAGDGGTRVVTRGTLPESGGTMPELDTMESETGGTARCDVLVVSSGGGLEGVARRLAEDLCLSPRERAVYSDCQHRERDQA